MTRLPVLEVGGTHASAVIVDTERWQVLPEPVTHVPLAADAESATLLDALARCVNGLALPVAETLAVAMPGPFDYANGIGRFSGVGKFESLAGVDVMSGLRERVRPRSPRRVVFVNDAAAFGIGEWAVGPAHGTARLVAITLGTGVGSAFVADGEAVERGPDVPPNGHVHRLSIGDRPLEDVVSRRAILAQYRAAGGEDDFDVREIARLAARGDDRARASFMEPLTALGAALAPWLLRFGAQALVVGGSISVSWKLVEVSLRSGLAAGGCTSGATGDCGIAVHRSRDPQISTATGAAWHAVGGTTMHSGDDGRSGME